MTRAWALMGLVLVLMTVGAPAPLTVADDAGDSSLRTVIYLVRHAEKIEDGGRDPALTDAGRERAERLARMLSDESIAAVYCTPTIRSRETGRPVAALAGVTIAEYAPMDGEGLTRRIRTDHAGRRVVVVAHSNTIPTILAALGGPRIPELDEADYDRLFVILRDGRGGAATLQLRF